MTNGNPVSDCSYYYERTPLGIYLRTKSKVSFVLAALHHDSITADTLYRVDMSLGNRDKDPYATGQNLGGLANFYLGSTVAEGAKAYGRAIYPEPWDSTDVHFYYGSTGPRMAIVMRPGADPSDVKLLFTGQDSINVDWQGHLKLYISGKWVHLSQALAYQVNSTGNIVPVNWLPNYIVEPGNVTVGFEYDTYNPAWPLIFLAGYPGIAAGLPPDPRNLGWCTYAGGFGGDELESVEVDEEDDPYTCGYTWSSNFPVNPGTSVHEPFIAEPAGNPSAVVMKFLHGNKQLSWATYYGGSGMTKAHKLAVYKGADQARQYVFVTGSTNSQDFGYYRNPTSVFSNAWAENYLGGPYRAWIGAFLKENGVRYWASTFGAYNEDPTATHGLAIDVDDDGQLVMGGMIERYTSGALGAPTFPAFAQPWEYKRETGGAFFILFNLNYFLEWSSAYGSWHYYNGIPNTRITDLKWDRNSWNTSGIKSIWFCGSDWLGTPEVPFNAPQDATVPDLFVNPTGGYYNEAGNALIGRLNPTSHLIDYATLWPGQVAYGLNVTQTSVWVVGYAWDTDYEMEHMPEPEFGNGYVHYQTGTEGATDGFFLRFRRTPFDLVYGSLIGGQRDDVLLDVSTRAQGEVFMTGETRSSYGFSTDLNTDRYFQQLNNFTNRRDAFILSIKDADNPVMNWRTAFGGLRSDRGWGVAASANELYLCGATTSDNEDAFPLMEAIPDNPSNPGSYLDFMQYWNQGGGSSYFVPGYGYSHILSNMSHWEAPVEMPYIGHDAFIASFWLVEPPGVGINEPASMNLNVTLLSDDGHYLVRMPAAIAWQLELYDALGKRLDMQRMNDERFFIDLSTRASGAYLLRATDANGQVFTAKLIRP